MSPHQHHNPHHNPHPHHETAVVIEGCSFIGHKGLSGVSISRWTLNEFLRKHPNAGAGVADIKITKFGVAEVTKGRTENADIITFIRKDDAKTVLRILTLPTGAATGQIPNDFLYKKSPGKQVQAKRYLLQQLCEKNQWGSLEFRLRR